MRRRSAERECEKEGEKWPPETLIHLSTFPKAPPPSNVASTRHVAIHVATSYSSIFESFEVLFCHFSMTRLGNTKYRRFIGGSTHVSRIIN